MEGLIMPPSAELNVMFGMIINKEFRITFQPKAIEQYGKRRFSVGAGRLQDYIGKDNAIKCIGKAIKKKDDKYRRVLIKYGIVDIYSK